MLQLPTHSSRRRFSKAEIAEITSGKTTVRTKRPRKKLDLLPVICHKADIALSDYIDALNHRHDLNQKLPVEDRAYPCVYPPNDLPSALIQGVRFTDEGQIDKIFQRTLRQYRGALRESRASVRRLKDRKDLTGLRCEKQRDAESYARKLAVLPSYIAPLKKALQKEKKRLEAIQKKSGYTEAKERVVAARKALIHQTRQVNRRVPTTTAGAVALLDFVSLRLRSDLYELFSDEGKQVVFCDFQKMMRIATAFLKKAASDD